MGQASWEYGASGTRNMVSFMMSLRPLKGENMRRRRHEPLLQEGRDIPFGPPPEAYLYRCPVCSEEMLVNEAIIAVAIGAAQFRGAYPGGMPIIGCPGCNGETLKYVGED
jgi:hypothetical protein